MKYNENNKPLVCYQTQNLCYKGTRTMEVKGVLWHSTGANNPNLMRYVQPSDNVSDRAKILEIIGTNKYKNDWNHTDRQAGMNAFIGKLADGTIATVQTMPWNYRPWGCGSGSKGSCNDHWIQFEICEDSLTDKVYAQAVYDEAIELTAYLCKMFDLDPHGSVYFKDINVPVILCHSDSNKLGLGNSHSDVLHWFPKVLGKSMEDVRDDVATKMTQTTSKVETAVVGKTSTASDAQQIWNKLYTTIQNPFGVAGLMGNLQAESGLKSNNLQNTYETKLGYTDDTYTKAVDNGSYTNFINDSAGYGLAQWTYWSRKQALLEYTKAAKKSIGDWEAQIDYLMVELSKSYSSLLKTLKNATSVQQASDAVLLQFEKPADQSEAMKAKRASYGETYFNTYGAALIIAQKGNKGEKVKKIQTALLQKNYDLGKWGADGDFGSATETAIKNFQSNNNLKATGKVDWITYELLTAAPPLYTLTVEHLSIEDIAKIQTAIPTQTLIVIKEPTT